jgi:hypothetical protein
MKTIASAALFLALLAAGCSGKKEDSKTNDKPKDGPKKTDKEGHEHGAGPNKGTIVEWGPDEQYHLEFTVNHPTKEVKVYVLGGDAKTAKPIKADKLTLSIKKPAFQIELKPLKQEGDPEGKVSCFAGKHDNFGVEQEFEGSITGVLDGKQYTGDFKEEEEKPTKK